MALEPTVEALALDADVLGSASDAVVLLEQSGEVRASHSVTVRVREVAVAPPTRLATRTWERPRFESLLSEVLKGDPPSTGWAQARSVRSRTHGLAGQGTVPHAQMCPDSSPRISREDRPYQAASTTETEVATACLYSLTRVYGSA